MDLEGIPLSTRGLVGEAFCYRDTPNYVPAVVFMHSMKWDLDEIGMVDSP